MKKGKKKRNELLLTGKENLSSFREDIINYLCRKSYGIYRKMILKQIGKFGKVVR